MDETSLDELRAVINHYRDLLEPFVAGILSADQFERQFQERYLATDSKMSTPVFDVVDRFFADVDEYVSDVALREAIPDAIGPDELRHLAARLLRTVDGQHDKS